MAPPTYHNIPIGAHRQPILGTDWQTLSGAADLCNRILDGSQQAIQDRGYATLATFFLTTTHLEIYEFRPPKTREQEQSILGSVLHKGTPALRGFAMSRMGHRRRWRVVGDRHNRRPVSGVGNQTGRRSYPGVVQGGEIIHHKFPA